MTAGAAACPYPGLRRFDEDNAGLFFGREVETRAVIDRLTAARFLAVTGESGCGKSSLIRAGVVRELHRAHGSWRVAVLQPGADPFAHLALTLARIEQSDPARVDLEIAEAVLRSTSHGISDLLKHGRLPASENVLIVVDQFEELFRFKRSGPEAGEDARAFVRLLLAGIAQDTPKVYVIITMRSDYLGDCAEFRELPEAINRGEYLVPRMTREQMRSAIERPAEAAGTPVAPRLTARILNEAGDDPGQLPVVQHALMRTWLAWSADHAPDEPVDIRHYEVAGTLATALSAHAEETWKALETPRLQAVAERFFRALTETRLGGRPVRRPAPLSRIASIAGATASEISAVAVHFAAPGRGFVCYAGEPGPPESPGTIIDITHESLITRWGRLREWVQAEAADADLYRALARDAGLHASGEKSLWRDPELSTASRWLSERQPSPEWAAQYAPGFEQAVRFIDASKRAELRSRRIRLGLVWGTVLLLFVAAAAFAWAKRQQAETQRLRAEAALSERDRLQRRVAELTAENPQLSDAAAALRKENRELQWTILQLQNDNRSLESEAASLQAVNRAVAAGIDRASSERAVLETQIAAEERRMADVKQRIATLEREERKVRTEWESAFQANNSLRLKALESGLFVEVPTSTAGIRPPSPERPAAIEQQVQTATDATRPQVPSETEKLQFQVRELERENLLLRQSIEELRVENQRLRAQEVTERKRNTQLRTERDRLRAEHDALNAKLQNLERSNAVLSSKLRDIEFQTRTVSLQAEAIEFRIASMRRAISQLAAESRIIERALRQR